VRIFWNTKVGILGNLKMGVSSVYQLVPKRSRPWGEGSERQSWAGAVLTVRVRVCRHQLETPGHYSHLAAFYEDKKGVLHAGPGRGGSLPPVYWLPSIHRYMYPEMKITHPAGCMSQFIKFFGEQIIILWKFALLRKRILIFSPPPVGVVCYRGN